MKTVIVFKSGRIARVTDAIADRAVSLGACRYVAKRFWKERNILALRYRVRKEKP